MKANRLIAALLALVLCLFSAPGALAEAAEALEETPYIIPEFNFTEKEAPESEALAFTRRMGLGFNLGNTFDAIKANWNRNADEMTVETSWGAPRTSETVMIALKQAGFSSIRIPVSWHDHVDADYNISQRWLDRVQEVVDWAIGQDLIVILNIHHDEDQFLPSAAHYEESARYVEKIWQQLAERFGDYDERLVFESLNEPRLVNTIYEWNFNETAPQCIEAADCLNRLNQLFVDTVRATGGNNATRYLMVPAYAADPGNALKNAFALPTDTVENRIILSVHAYRPYNFALNINGTSSFSLSSNSAKGEITSFMTSLYNRYIVNGIPVVIGEFGAMTKGDNLQDRIDWAAFYVASASIRHLPCLWWDNAGFTGSGELFGLMDRVNGTWVFPELVEAMTRHKLQ